MDFSISPAARQLLQRVKAMIRDEITPCEDAFHAEVSIGDRWQFTERQTDILEGLKSRAKSEGLWNLWLTEGEGGPGLSTVDLTGHTPGHIGVRIADAGQSLLIVSDMLFHPLVHPARADIGFVFEQDPAAAQAMRSRFFPLAAEEGALIAATHMPFPGLGRIGRDAGTLRWVPENWAYAL